MAKKIGTVSAIMGTLLVLFLAISPVFAAGIPDSVRIEKFSQMQGQEFNIGYSAFVYDKTNPDPNSRDKWFPVGRIVGYKMLFPGFTKYGIYYSNAFFIFEIQSGLRNPVSFSWNESVIAQETGVLGDLVNVTAGIAIVIGWPVACFLLFFLKGYTRFRYPGAEKGVNPFDEESTSRVKRNATGWMLGSGFGFIVWLILLPLVTGLYK